MSVPCFYFPRPSFSFHPCCLSRHALFGLFLSHHSCFWKEILYHIMKITEEQQKNNRRTKKEQRKNKRGGTEHMLEIRGKLKSRTGQWSVRDFNFLEFSTCGLFFLPCSSVVLLSFFCCSFVVLLLLSPFPTLHF